MSISAVVLVVVVVSAVGAGGAAGVADAGHGGAWEMRRLVTVMRLVRRGWMIG